MPEWEYSKKAVDLILTYMREFPDVFTFLSKANNQWPIDLSNAYQGNVEKARARIILRMCWLWILSFFSFLLHIYNREDDAGAHHVMTQVSKTHTNIKIGVHLHVSVFELYLGAVYI